MAAKPGPKFTPTGHGTWPRMAAGGPDNPQGYSIQKKLGEGGFGCVYRAVHLRTNTICALKSIDISTLSQKYREMAIKQWLIEVGALLKVTSHKNVVGYRKAFDTGWKLWVEMEYCAGGDLSRYFKGWKTRISRTVKRTIMQNVAAAISYLHEKGIVHRDIKAENVLIAYSNARDTLNVTAKLADFGLAKVIATCNFDGSLENYYMDCTCGTRYYLAPEVLEGKYTLKADVFSMAVLFTAIVTESRIDGGYMTSYIKDVKGTVWSFGEYMTRTKADVALKSNFTAGDNLRRLLNSMLQYDYHKRPLAGQIHETISSSITVEDFPKNPSVPVTGKRDPRDRPPAPLPPRSPRPLNKK